MRPLSIVLVCAVAQSAAALAAPAATSPAQANFDTLMKQGRDALVAGRTDEATARFEEACPADQTHLFTNSRAGTCYHHLGVVAVRSGNQEAAIGIYNKAAAAWRAAGPEYIDSWGYTQLILADLYQQQRQTPKAEAAITAFIEVIRATGKQSSELYPQALTRLAVAYADTGRPELGQKVILEAVESLSKLAKPLPAELAYARSTLGVIDLSMGLQAEAESSLREAVQIASKELGEMSVETAGYQTNLALVLIAKGDLDGAETLLRRSRYVVERTPGASGNQLGMISAELSAVALKRNKLAIAGDEAKKALEILSHQKFPDSKSVALAQVNLADVHLHAGRLSEADQLLSEAIPAERRAAPQSRLLADGLRRFAKLRAAQGRSREAQDLYREAIGLYELRVGANHPAIAPLLKEYTEILRREGGSKAEIRTMEARAKSIASLAPVGFAPLP